MAVLWSKRIHDTHYEVRSAGATVRLYSNGVLHSQYNPNKPISGAIWDLLLLPGFCSEQPPKNILVLGLGGGTLVHLIRLFFPDSQITCVEIDKTHIQIAKRWFNLPKKNVRTIEGEAYGFLKSDSNTYDWIIDDVFQHVTGDPERGFPLDEAQRLYETRLAKNGILSLNVIGRKQLIQTKKLLALSVFNDGLQFSHPLYDNRIVCLMPKSELSNSDQTKQIKERFNQHKLLDQSRRTCRLKYKMQWLK